VEMKRIQIAGRIFPTLFPILVFVYVIKKIQSQDACLILSNLSVKRYLLGFVIYTLNQVMRTSIFFLLLPKRSSFQKPCKTVLLILSAIILLILVFLQKILKKKGYKPLPIRSFLTQMGESFRIIHNVRNYLPS